jgi:hypothetical protein
MKHCCIAIIGLFFCTSTMAADTSDQKKHTENKFEVGNLECISVTLPITEECKRIDKPHCFLSSYLQNVEADSFDRCRTLQYRVRDNPYLRNQLTPEISEILFQCAKNPVGLSVSAQNKIDSFLG